MFITGFFFACSYTATLDEIALVIRAMAEGRTILKGAIVDRFKALTLGCGIHHFIRLRYSQLPNFLPALFAILRREKDGVRLLQSPMKHAGMALVNPTKSAPSNEARTCLNTHLIAALGGVEPFRRLSMLLIKEIRISRSQVVRRRLTTRLKSILFQIANAIPQGSERGKKTGPWLSACYAIDGHLFDLSRISRHYQSPLPEGSWRPPVSYIAARCGQTFSVQHALLNTR
jgi:hypothetical protein